MVVEDEDKIRDILKTSIEKWGFQVYCAEDFGEVFQEFSRIKPQLVIMDINLPEYDGFHWCSKIREISKVPVLFLSSRSTNMDIVMAVNMGGDDYLTKPFSMEVLMAKINALLRRAYSYTETFTDTLNYMGVVLSLKDTLTVNINRLRRKLSEVGIEKFIKTVKNQGYMVK